MTYINIDTLEKRREAGLSPVGGVLSEKEAKVLLDKDPISMKEDQRVEMVDKLLLAHWNHPLDTRIANEIAGYAGQVRSIAQIHGAAGYVHDLRVGEKINAADKKDYDTLIASVRGLSSL